MDVPDAHRKQAQLSQRFGGLSLCPLSLHSCAAFEQTKESDKKVKSAVSKAIEGLLGKACKILTSSGIAPRDMEFAPAETP